VVDVGDDGDVSDLRLIHLIPVRFWERLGKKRAKIKDFFISSKLNSQP